MDDKKRRKQQCQLIHMKYICFILQLFSDLFTHKIEILDEMFSSKWSTKHFILVQALSIFAMSFLLIILTALSIEMISLL